MMAEDTNATATAVADPPANTGNGEAKLPEWKPGLKGEEAAKYREALRERAGLTIGKVDEPPVEKPNETTSGGGDEHSASADAGTKAEPEKAKPKTEEPVEWRDAEVQGLAAGYGIKPEKLAKIPSREVLDILLESIDQKGATAKAAEQPPTGQQQAVQQTNEPDPLAELEASLKESGGNLSSEDGPKILKALQAFRAAEVQRQQAVQQAAQQQFIRDAHSRFVTSLHELGYDDLYGEKGKTPTQEQKSRIEEAFQEHLQRAAILERRGGKPDESVAFVKRSAIAAHGERIVLETQTKLEQLQEKVNQSHRRIGGGSTKTLPPSKDASPLDRAMAKLPQTLRAMGIAGT